MGGLKGKGELKTTVVIFTSTVNEISRPTKFLLPSSLFFQIFLLHKREVYQPMANFCKNLQYRMGLMKGGVRFKITMTRQNPIRGTSHEVLKRKLVHCLLVFIVAFAFGSQSDMETHWNQYNLT